MRALYTLRPAKENRKRWRPLDPWAVDRYDVALIAIGARQGVAGGMEVNA